MLSAVRSLGRAAGSVSTGARRFLTTNAVGKSWSQLGTLKGSSSQRLLLTCFVRNNSVKAALTDFLQDEIKNEKAIARKKFQDTDVTNIPGFDIKTDESKVELTKERGGTLVKVKFNISHSLEYDENMNEEGPTQVESEGSEEVSPPLTSKPPFTVEISKDGQTLGFSCSFVEENVNEAGTKPEELEQDVDLFTIDEVYLTTGEEDEEQIYRASGDIIDGTLYDHLMRYLEEQGVGLEFAEQLMDFATHYEHAQYVNLLQRIQNFVSKSG